jgi:hypothetical protein
MNVVVLKTFKQILNNLGDTFLYKLSPKKTY